MKKIILIFITSLFIGCAPTVVQVTFDDENSNTIREHLQHYVDGDIDSMMSIIADDAEIYINSDESVSAGLKKPDAYTTPLIPPNEDNGAL